jgi:hypothetical protein
MERWADKHKQEQQQRRWSEYFPAESIGNQEGLWVDK